MPAIILNSFADCVNRYGHPWFDPKGFETTWMQMWEGGDFDCPLKRAYINKDLADMLPQSLQALQDAGCLGEIKTFDGCWDIRQIRGSVTLWSQHSFGIAIDLNAAIMPLGSNSQWSPKFVRVMEELGWTWGGRFKRMDPMHWQLAHNC